MNKLCTCPYNIDMFICNNILKLLHTVLILCIYNPVEVDIYTDIDMNAIRKECKDLDKLLMSASDVELDNFLGEGIRIICYKYHKIFIL